MTGRRLGRPRTPRAQFFAAAAVGGLIAFLVFAWFALGGHLDPLREESLANFYEVQARSWLHGHWDAGPGDFLFERFNVDGRYYTYFGPAPALLRLPVVLFTDSLDGRLSRLSMMLAFAVLLVGATALAWQGRRALRGDGPPTRATLVAAGGFVFVSGCGTTALFLASKTWVYHEAILWGAAWAVASFAFLIAYLSSPSPRLLAGASAAAALSILSRGSVGLGPVAALGIVVAGRVVGWAWRRFRPHSRGSVRLVHLLGLDRVDANPRLWPAAIAVAVPVALYALVNRVKFGTFLGTPPYELQDLLAARPNRQAALAANDGSLFGLHYAPTILLAYFRPDAITIDRFFPWVSFAPRPRIVGDAVFEATNFSAGITVTSLVFVVLVVLGLWAAIRVPRAAVFRVPLVGCAVGCAGMFALAFIDERYLGDIVPLLVVGGALGLWWVPRLLAGRARTVRVAALTGLVVVAAWSVWATVSLTLLDQREFGPNVTTGQRADFLDFQLGVHDLVPGGDPSRVQTGGLALPPPGPAGSLYVAGDCAGLYWSNGRSWLAVEQTPSTGRYDVDVTLEPTTPGTRTLLLSRTDAHRTSTVWIERLDDTHVRFVYEWTGPYDPRFEEIVPDAERLDGPKSEPVVLPPGEPTSLTVRLDPLGYVGVIHDGRVVLSHYAPVADAGPAEVGTAEVRRPPTPICDELTGTRRGT